MKGKDCLKNGDGSCTLGFNGKLFFIDLNPIYEVTIFKEMKKQIEWFLEERMGYQKDEILKYTKRIDAIEMEKNNN